MAKNQLSEFDLFLFLEEPNQDKTYYVYIIL